MLGILWETDAVPRLDFASAKANSKTDFLGKGRSITLIVDGEEHEFFFSASLAEREALAALDESGVPILNERGPFRAALLAQGIVFALIALKLVLK